MNTQNRYERHLIIFRMGIYFMILNILVLSCSTTKKTAEQKVYEARQARIALLQDLRKEFPCDSSQAVTTVHLDTAYLPLPSSGPDAVKNDGSARPQIITKTITNTVTVRDKSLDQEKRDSIDNMLYSIGTVQESFNKYIKEAEAKQKSAEIAAAKQEAQIESLKPWKKWVIIGISGMAAAGVLFGVAKLKSFI